MTTAGGSGTTIVNSLKESGYYDTKSDSQGSSSGGSGGGGGSSPKPRQTTTAGLPPGTYNINGKTVVVKETPPQERKYPAPTYLTGSQGGGKIQYSGGVMTSDGKIIGEYSGVGEPTTTKNQAEFLNDQEQLRRAQETPGIYHLSSGESIVSTLLPGSTIKTSMRTPIATKTTGGFIYANEPTTITVKSDSSYPLTTTPITNAISKNLNAKSYTAIDLFNPENRTAIRENIGQYATVGALFASAKPQGAIAPTTTDMSIPSNQGMFLANLFTNKSKTYFSRANTLNLFTPKNLGARVNRNLMVGTLEGAGLVSGLAGEGFSLGANLAKIGESPVTTAQLVSAGTGIVAGIGIATAPEITVPILVIAGGGAIAYTGKELAESKSQERFNEVLATTAVEGGLFYGGMKFGKGITPFKLTQALPQFRSVSVDLPLKNGEQMPDAYYGVSLEKGGKTLGQFGLQANKGFVKGTPVLDLKNADFSEGVPIQTYGEARIYEKNLQGIAKPEEISKIGLVRDINIGAQYAKTKFYGESINLDTQTLNRAGVGATLEFSNTEKGINYGSFASNQQLPKETLERTPADLDQQFKATEKELTLKVKTHATFLRTLGNPTSISKKSPLLIESGGRHAVDIHAIDTPNRDISGIVPERSLGWSLNQPPKEFGGVKFQTLNENMFRKGSSILTIRETERGVELLPESHRLKDVKDYVTFANQELTKKGVSINDPLRMKLRELESLYPRDTTAAIAKEPLPSNSRFKSIFNYPLAAGSPLTSLGKNKSFSRSLSMPTSFSPSPSSSRSISGSLGLSPSQSISTRSMSSSIGFPSKSLGLSPSISLSLSRSLSPSSSIYSPPSLPPSFPPSFAPGLPLFANMNTPNIDILGNKQQFKYRPSVTSVILNIKGKPPRTSGLSGLEIRPIWKK
jgi:hypothetical protein